MNAPHTDRPAPLSLALEGEMTIRRASELKPMLAPALLHPGGLRLDLSGVSEIDTTGVQLLLATKQALQLDCRPFELSDCSRAVVDVVELLGLLDLLTPSAIQPADGGLH